MFIFRLFMFTEAFSDKGQCPRGWGYLQKLSSLFQQQKLYLQKYVIFFESHSYLAGVTTAKLLLHFVKYEDDIHRVISV